MILVFDFPRYDSETESESQASSPVKTRKNRMNGHRNTTSNSPKKSKPQTTRKPAPPISDEETVSIEIERVDQSNEENFIQDDSNEINEVSKSYHSIITKNTLIQKTFFLSGDDSC